MEPEGREENYCLVTSGSFCFLKGINGGPGDWDWLVKPGTTAEIPGKNQIAATRNASGGRKRGREVSWLLLFFYSSVLTMSVIG